MSINREEIWAALLARLKTALANKFKIISRRHVMPPDLAPAQQPALFLCQTGELRSQLPERTDGTLKLEGVLIVYLTDTNANPVPGREGKLAVTELNDLLATIEDAIAPDVEGELQTLGDLCYRCWIEGNTEMEAGIIGQQLVAVVPINIVIPF
ncbi:MAG: hypothetical protein M3P27_02910 [Acidobacteriota bacterium]|nr:hypothetical protein [Acidobacteriota bacterium]